MPTGTGTSRQYIRQWDYSKYNLVDPVIEPKKMSMLQIDVALADCYRKFYMGKILDVMTMKDDFKRGYLLRATKLFMSSHSSSGSWASDCWAKSGKDGRDENEA